jgi:ABC-type lipoprotein export system ATPase subunit
MLTEEGKKVRAALDAELAERAAAFKVEQREMLKELAEVGIEIDMVNLLSRRTVAENVQAMPILMKHLRRDYSEGTLDSLARSLAIKEAGEYWDELVAMYRQSADRTPTGAGNFAMALADAVSEACPPSRINELIDLLRDRRLPHRVLLLTPLRKRRGRDPAIAQVIEELRHDPALSKEIGSWKILKSQAVPRSH